MRGAAPNVITVQLLATHQQRQCTMPETTAVDMPTCLCRRHVHLSLRRDHNMRTRHAASWSWKQVFDDERKQKRRAHNDSTRELRTNIRYCSVSDCHHTSHD